jgi:hypothetical protein
MENLKPVDITLPDRPGVLGELCSILWGNGVSIRACTIQVGHGCLLIRLGVDKPILARDLTRYFGSVLRNQAKSADHPQTLGFPNSPSAHEQGVATSKAVVTT